MKRHSNDPVFINLLRRKFTYSPWQHLRQWNGNHCETFVKKNVDSFSIKTKLYARFQFSERPRIENNSSANLNISVLYN